MPQRELFGSTFSKFDTNKNLETPIQYLKGVGPKIARLLEVKGIKTLRDALFYLPRDYQDRSQIRLISSLQLHETVLVQGKVLGYSFVPLRKLKRPLLEARISDGSGTLSIKWFHYNKNYLETKLHGFPRLLVYGSISAFNAKLGMIHPDIEWDVDDEDLLKSQRLMPVYAETEGLTQKLIRRIIGQALDVGLNKLSDDLPEPVRQKYRLLPIASAVRSLHRPPNTTSILNLKDFKTPEQHRLIFEEFFKFELIVGQRRLKMRREKTKPYPYNKEQKGLEQFLKRVSFELTRDQLFSIEKIYDDLSQDKPMNRLLQGDVGCGKTIVALAACIPVIAFGGQVAILAPTEILAEQHYGNMISYLEGLSIQKNCALRAGCLSGSTPRARREEILKDLYDGKIHCIVGTHALLEKGIQFQELGLVVIDEQHRFGVDQRLTLRAKGRNPHVLSLTATPIPRTLALTAYGDLDVSTIRERPKGRLPVVTQIVKPAMRPQVLQQVKFELQKGRQAYVIYPLIEESEKIDLANAISGAEELAKDPFSEFQVGLLHGRMKPAEKQQMMDLFKNGKIHILVSTTVVEVGVDVPNATALIVENSERFGLSQLHQLRGRIGRGQEASTCFLMTHGASPEAYERLKAMESTHDGFKLAELDLKIRGPGEFLGTRQSGELQFQFANLVRDQIILQEARKAAFELLAIDSELQNPENVSLREYMKYRGQLQQQRFETA